MNYIGFYFVSIKAKGRNLHNFSMKDHTYLEVLHNLLHIGYRFSYELTNLYGTKQRTLSIHFLMYVCIQA